MQQPEPKEPKKNLLLEARHTLSIAAAKRKRASVSTSLFLPRNLAREGSELMTGSYGSTKQHRSLQRRLRKRRPSIHPESFAVVPPRKCHERIRYAVDILRQGVDNGIQPEQEPMRSETESDMELDVNSSNRTTDNIESLNLLNAAVEEPLQPNVQTPEKRDLNSMKLELLTGTSSERNSETKTDNYAITMDFVVDYATAAELTHDGLQSEDAEAHIELANYVAASEEQRSSSKMSTAFEVKNDFLLSKDFKDSVLRTPECPIKVEMDEDHQRSVEVLNEADSVQPEEPLDNVAQPMEESPIDGSKSVDLPFSNRVSVIIRNQAQQSSSAGPAKCSTISEAPTEVVNQQFYAADSMTHLQKLQQSVKQMADDELFRALLPPPCQSTPIDPPPPYSIVPGLPRLQTPLSHQHPATLEAPVLKMETQDLEQGREFNRHQVTFEGLQTQPLWAQLGELAIEPFDNHIRRSLQPPGDQITHQQLKKAFRNSKATKHANNRDVSMALNSGDGFFVGAPPVSLYSAKVGPAAAAEARHAVMPAVVLPSTSCQQQQSSETLLSTNPLTLRFSETQTYEKVPAPSVSTGSESTAMGYNRQVIEGEQRQPSSGRATLSTAYLNQLTSGKPLNLATLKRRKPEMISPIHNKRSAFSTSTTWSSSGGETMSAAFVSQQAKQIPLNLTTLECHDSKLLNAKHDIRLRPSTTINDDLVHFESTTSLNQHTKAGTDARRAAMPAMSTSAAKREQMSKTATSRHLSEKSIQLKYNKMLTHSASNYVRGCGYSESHQHLDLVRGVATNNTIRQPICDQATMPLAFPNQQTSQSPLSLTNFNNFEAPNYGNNQNAPIARLSSGISTSIPQLQTPNFGLQQMRTMPMTYYPTNPYLPINQSQLYHELRPTNIHDANTVSSFTGFSAIHEPRCCMEPHMHSFSATNREIGGSPILEALVKHKSATPNQSQALANQSTVVESPQRLRQRRKPMHQPPMVAPPAPRERQLTNPLCALMQLGPQRMPGPPPLLSTRNTYFPISPPLTPTYQQQFTTDYSSPMAPPASLYAQHNNYFNLSFPVEATLNMPSNQTTSNTGNFFEPGHDRPLGQPRPFFNYFDGERFVNLSHENCNNFFPSQQIDQPTSWVNNQAQSANFYRSI